MVAATSPASSLATFDADTALAACDILATIRGYRWERELLAALLVAPVPATRSGFAAAAGRTWQLWQVGRFLRLGLMTDREIIYSEEVGSRSFFDCTIDSYGSYSITPVGRAVAAGLGINEPS